MHTIWRRYFIVVENIYTMPDTEALFPYTRWCTMPTNGGIMYTQCGEVVVFARVNTIHTIHGGGVVDT